MNSIPFRIFADIILVLLLIIAPWWVTGFFMIVAALYFPRFHEILAFGIMAELMYGAPGIFPASAVFAFVVWTVSIIVRPRLSLY